MSQTRHLAEPLNTERTMDNKLFRQNFSKMRNSQKSFRKCEILRNHFKNKKFFKKITNSQKFLETLVF